MFLNEGEDQIKSSKYHLESVVDNKLLDRVNCIAHEML